MAWIADNWMIIVAACAVAGLIGWRVAVFLKQDRTAQLNNVKEWLLWSVTEAERAFGAGTGKLKLRYVYDSFLAAFPWLGKAISFQIFSDLVDDALASMRTMLETNERAKEFVEDKF